MLGVKMMMNPFLPSASRNKSSKSSKTSKSSEPQPATAQPSSQPSSHFNRFGYSKPSRNASSMASHSNSMVVYNGVNNTMVVHSSGNNTMVVHGGVNNSMIVYNNNDSGGSSQNTTMVYSTYSNSSSREATIGKAVACCCDHKDTEITECTAC
jgi:hypothetical protein